MKIIEMWGGIFKKDIRGSLLWGERIRVLYSKVYIILFKISVILFFDVINYDWFVFVFVLSKRDVCFLFIMILFFLENKVVLVLGEVMWVLLCKILIRFFYGRLFLVFFLKVLFYILVVFIVISNV